jgi:hypothetical protein
MKARRPSLFLFFATLSVIPAVPARAEVPEAGLRERQWDLARANERFEAGRFEQALAVSEPYESCFAGWRDMVMEFAITAQAKP